MEGVIKTSCSATVLKQLKTVVQEFVLGCSPTAKNELKRNSFKFIFQRFWPYSRKSYTSEEAFLSKNHFCKTPLSAWFCILCSLWVRNSKLSSFFLNFHLPISYDNICDNVLVATERLVMLHCADMGTSLSYNFFVSSFFITFTSYMNKFYKNFVQC